METTAKVSFKDKIKAMKLTEFEFVSFRKEITSPDEESGGKRKTLIVLELSTPIPKVVSSHSEWWAEKDKRVNPFVTDVKEVSVEFDLMSDDEWTFNENDKGELTLTGSYGGDLFLDVSRSNRVWLTDTKLSKKSNDWKQGKRTERMNKLFGG